VLLFSLISKHIQADYGEIISDLERINTTDTADGESDY